AGLVVAVELRFQHGVEVVPKGKEGLADLMADAVLEGTQRRSAAQLAADIPDIAAQLTSNVGPESAALHLNVLRETLDRGLLLLADVVTQPAFRSPDVERVKALHLAGLEQKVANIARLADDESRRLLFGPDH